MQISAQLKHPRIAQCGAALADVGFEYGDHPRPDVGKHPVPVVTEPVGQQRRPVGPGIHQVAQPRRTIRSPDEAENRRQHGRIELAQIVQPILHPASTSSAPTVDPRYRADDIVRPMSPSRATTQTSSTTADQVVFDPAGTGYDTFRIPALLAIRPPQASGDPLLLAFCEGRIESSADHGPIELVLRRSVDGGRNWQPLQLVCRADQKTCGNPAPVVDPASGDIVLLSVQNGARARESAITDGSVDPRDARRVFVQRSADRGLTWTEPADITEQVSRPDWGWYATGPCHGIALQHGNHRGRLVVPANHSTIPNDGIETDTMDSLYGGHCIISDDGGHNWRIGFVADYAGDAINPNETTVAELEDGRVIFNARNYHGSAGRRLQATSGDGGETLTGPYEVCPSVTAPDIQASLLSLDGSRLLLSTPSQSDARRDLTIFVSDDASSWQSGALINSGFSGYSDLTVLEHDRIGVLYEAGAAAANEEIRFAVTDAPGGPSMS